MRLGRRAGRWWRGAVAVAGLFLVPAGPTAWGAYPGENGRIAFTRAVESSTSAIYSMGPDGSDVKRLTFAGGFNQEPSWSPDGTRIAFASNRDGDFDIWVMNADGSDQRRVQNHPETDTSPTWSPDGTQIAFDSDRDTPISGGSANEIYATTLDGRERPVTQIGGFAGYPAWAPDGSEIAFYVSAPSTARLSAAAPAGGAARPITTPAPASDPPRFHFQPDWAPDSSRLAFWSESGDLWSVARGGGRLLPLIVSVDRDFEPAFSPDGLRMAFRRQVDDQNGEIFASDASGSNAVRLTFDPAYDSEPDWQHKPPPPPPPPVPEPPSEPRPGTPSPGVPRAPGCVAVAEVLGNRDDEDCDGAAEAFPVVSAIVRLTGQRFRQERRVKLLALRVFDLAGGETVSVACRGRCSRKVALKRTVARRTGQLVLDREVVGDWVRTDATLMVRIARAGYAAKVWSYRMRQGGGAVPWIERRDCDLPGGGEDDDCDGFRDLPVLRARARLGVSAGKRETRLRTLRLSRLEGGESVTLACRGRGCGPALTRTTTVPAGTSALRLDPQVAGARLRAGARLELTVAKAGAVARVFRWTFRAGRKPLVQALCRQPGARRPARCPGA